jgi:hypothetical protein
VSDAALARAYGCGWLAVGLLGWLLGGSFGLVLVTVPALAVAVVALVAAGTPAGPYVVALEALGVAAFFCLAEARYAAGAEGLVRDFGSALHNHAFPHAAAVVALLNIFVAAALVVRAGRH